MEKIAKLGGPLAPVILGLIMATTAIVCGAGIPVGPYCSNAFSPEHELAQTEDRRQSYNIFRETDYEAVCQASAAQWSAVWWGVFTFAVVVMCIGFVLMSRARQATPVPAAIHTVQAGRGQGVVSELFHLAQLREQGLITQSQFEQLRENLIGE
ncbi:hypothetical protein FBY31_3568 [Arthrobacter sp. SLBN-100]|uniref:hypothetical protein n=1 Tax=Arthrobacter sp. SLBN-100 TaxID=2768450 RepID=UPI001150EC2B|nr:hypothetical protein [Arthrobacter sp. SLBN-100]TQJ69424.1 hypothetical protein FBY31_3568 [Arthrobacter sp. SLBN-100]